MSLKGWGKRWGAWGVASIATVLSAGHGSTAARGQGVEWIWMGGNSAVPTCTFPVGCGQPGVYGTQGTPGVNNEPGGRYGASNWSDTSGNIWLFGGVGNDSNGVPGGMDDLWKLNVAAGEWTWMGGSSLLPGKWRSEPPSFGTQGTAATSNTPGFRNYSSNWTDSSGNLWLFSGGGGTDGNDLWKLQSTPSEWTWVGGLNPASPGTSNGSGVYGVLGLPGSSHWPGTRVDSYNCTDPAGNLWLFGGGGRDSVGNGGLLNDLWVYYPTIGQWAWMAGSTTVLPPGYSGATTGGPTPVYGAQGVPAAGNTPGGRQAGTCWFDTGGNLWLFGGYGQHMSGLMGDWNDLWEFNPTTLEWTWMSGSDDLPDCQNGMNICGNRGVFGALGVATGSNTPGARVNTTAWTDHDGNFWLFGGTGFDANDNYGLLNDLWEFSPISREWIWQGGGTSATGNCVMPIDSPICGSAGSYGTKGVGDSANTPGARDSSMAWVDSGGNFWLFGGEGFDGLGQYGDLNDLWMIRASVNGVPVTATPTLSVPSGTYMSSQVVTISDPTAGATIYYSTDGTPPTLGSPVYSGPVSVTRTEAVEAIAVAAGHATSGIGTGSYVLPVVFTLAASSGTLQLKAGTSGAVTVTVTPINGFNSAVSLQCSGLSLLGSCSLSPATVTPSGGAVVSTLTITAPLQALEIHPRARPILPLTLAALAICFFQRKERGLLRLMLLGAVTAFSIGLIPGCGGGSASGGGGGNGGGGGGGSSPVTSTVTVTATSGSVVQTATISLTVN